MKFEMETEPLPASRPYNNGNRRRPIVKIACIVIICVLLIFLYLKLESVNSEIKRPGYEPGLRGHDGPTGQPGAPGAAVHPGEPGLHGPTGPTRKTGPPGTAAAVDGVITATEGIQNLTASKGVVEGIIAGTLRGLVIIPLDSLDQRTISSTLTRGVAFNWQSRKVYWIEYKIGIKIAELDGSLAELLISDTSELFGLAVDQNTGNFYYGVLGSNPRIRVCDSRGKKCVTVVSGINNMGTYIWDIALIPSQGLMFWSNLSDSKGLTRANMDGTNASVIILEHIFGLDLDEFTEKLYWTNYYGKSIGHRDFNGYNRNVLLNTTMYPYDVAVDGDTLYFGGYSPNGVYSFTSNGKMSSIANTTGAVHHIALYGRNKVSPRPNPCKNSPCPNLCVLTRVSFTCL